MRLASEILIPESKLTARVEAMAAAITADTPEGTRLSVLALLDGAFMFCADLVRRLPMPIHLALVPMASIERGGDPASVPLPPGFPIRGADILVLEDILDTGRTLSALKARILAEGPARLRVAVLLDKPARRAVDFRPDYRGFEVPDRWIVGYGLDVEGLYRNLPYVTYVVPA
jgi:hypoxanthine phosphoribosyltransferase